MKVPVEKLDEDRVRQAYPIADRAPGWFFRCEEQSNNVWHVEGTDLWGRKASATGHDYESVLNKAIQSAEQINAQLASLGG